MDKQEKPKEKYVFPLFSKEPIPPRLRDIPWILCVIAIGWGLQYTPLAQMQISDRRAGLVLIGTVAEHRFLPVLGKNMA
jgi:hypothetical protein